MKKKIKHALIINTSLKFELIEKSFTRTLEHTQTNNLMIVMSVNRDKNEKEPRLFRRSIFVSEDIDKNDKISEKNIKVVRPAHGLHPIYKKYLIGKKLKFSLKKGTPLKLSHLDVKRVPKLI